jgi:hypothetical protein
MAKKSKARLARDQAQRNRQPTTINVDEDRTYRELSLLRPGLTYPELREWVEGMSERERAETLKGIAKKIVSEQR